MKITTNSAITGLRYAILIAGTFLLSILLFLIVFIQPNGDDFCMLKGSIFHPGFTDIVDSSGRWSSIFLFHILYRFGTASLKIIPLISFLLFIATSFLVYKSLSSILLNRARSIDGLVLSFCFTVSLVLSLHYFYQAAFWSTSVIVYFLPLSLINIMAFLLFTIPTRRAFKFIAVCLLGLLIVLFNQVFIILIGWFAILIFLYALRVRERELILISLVMGLIVVIGLANYYLAPGTHTRLASNAHPSSISSLTRLTIDGYRWYVSDLLVSTQSLSSMIFVASVSIYLFLDVQRREIIQKLLFKREVGISLLALASSIVVSVMAIASLYYAQDDFPAPRVLLPVYYVSLVSVTIIVVCFISLLFRSLGKRISVRRLELLLVLTASFCIIFGVLISIKTLKNTYPQIVSYDTSSRIEQSNIAIAKSRGENSVVVGINAIDSLGWPHPQSDFWLNRCMASWYGVESLKASGVKEDINKDLRPTLK